MARATERFLIFALPRSGSTSLAHALNCHPDIRCCLEPFNTTRTDIPVPARVEDRETLEERLARIREEYNGIKHVYVPAGWPFPEGSTLNGYLLRRPGHRVILLHRRNLLQQIVSNEMAIQSQVFREDRGEYHARIGEVRFRPRGSQGKANPVRFRHWKDRPFENHEAGDGRLTHEQ